VRTEKIRKVERDAGLHAIGSILTPSTFTLTIETADYIA
jgi:hypothetical protein